MKIGAVSTATKEKITWDTLANVYKFSKCEMHIGFYLKKVKLAKSGASLAEKKTNTTLTTYPWLKEIIYTNVFFMKR